MSRSNCHESGSHSTQRDNLDGCHYYPCLCTSAAVAVADRLSALLLIELQRPEKINQPTITLRKQPILVSAVDDIYSLDPIMKKKSRWV